MSMHLIFSAMLNSSQNFKATIQHLVNVFPSISHPLYPMFVQSGIFMSLFQVNFEDKI